MTDGEWTVLYGDVKVKTKALPDVDPDKLMEQVLESALNSGFADLVGPLNLRPDEGLVKVGTVVALCLALREARQTHIFEERQTDSTHCICGIRFPCPAHQPHPADPDDGLCTWPVLCSAFEGDWTEDCGEPLPCKHHPQVR